MKEAKISNFKSIENICKIYKKYKESNSDIKDLDNETLYKLIPENKTEELMNEKLVFSTRQKEIIEIPLCSRIPDSVDEEDILQEIIKLRAENKYLKLENEELKQYRYYYKAVFAETFDQFEDHDNAYFNNLKELFKMYMIPDEKLNPKALPLKYQLYAFVIFISNYIKEDEFYGYILRYMLYNSKNFSNNLEDYKELDAIIKLVVDTDNHKLLKQVIQDNITKKY